MASDVLWLWDGNPLTAIRYFTSVRSRCTSSRTPIHRPAGRGSMSINNCEQLNSLYAATVADGPRCCVYVSVLVLRGTAVPFFHGTSTVAFTVLFSTAIPQVPRFFDTVLVCYWHRVTKSALYFDWNCNLRLVFCRSPLNFTRFTYVLYVVLFYSVCQMSEMTSLRQWLAFSVNNL